MSTPSINYRDAIQVFLNVQDNDNIYISHSLTTTKDKKDCATFEEISTLAQIAIQGLKQQIDTKSESFEKLKSHALALKNYLVKVKDNPEVQDTTHRLFLDLFKEVEAEIKQLSEIDESLHEQDLKTFSDDELSKIANEEEFHLKFQKYGIRDDKTKFRIAKLIIDQQETTKILEFIQNWGIRNQKTLIEIAKRIATKDGYGISLFILNFGIKDQDALIEIAKLSAKQNGEMTSRYIKNYGIEKESKLIEIARLAAQENGIGTSEHIQNYGIRDRKALIGIAKMVAKDDGEGISLYIQNYGIGNKGLLFETSQWALRQIGLRTLPYASKEDIDGQEALIEIARLAVQQNNDKTSRYIQNYGIKDQKALIKILKLALTYGSGNFIYIPNFGIKDQNALIEIAKQAPTLISLFIQYFGIKDQRALIEIAKLSAQESGLTSQYIKNYGIKDQDALIEIAKLAAQNASWRIPEHIHKYGIKNERALIEIAKSLAQENGRSISQYIRNFGIKDKAALIEIAKLAAQEDGLSTSDYINNYGIKDKKALIEIAKIAAKSKKGGVSYFIKEYDIQNQEALIEIALLAAQNQYGRRISAGIKNFGITDQRILIEIAKLAAQANGYETSEHIQNYGIQDQDVLIEIAKLAARQDGGGTSAYINNFKITDQRSLIEIAKLSAQQNGSGISRFIGNYGIEEQRALSEIAKLAAQQNAVETSEYIGNYHLQDQETLIEIAKLVAQKDLEVISRHIQNYGIKNEEFLIEIAKLVATQYGGVISQNIKNYGIQNQETLIEIAKLAAKQDPYQTTSFIKNYGIKDEMVLVEMAKEAVQKCNGLYAYQYIQCYNIESEANKLAIFCAAFKNNPNSIQVGIEQCNLSFPKEVQALSEDSYLIELQKVLQWPDEFSPIFKEFGKEAPKKEDILFFIYVGLKFFKKTPILKDIKLWNSIFHYRDPKMRYELVDMIFALDETQAKIYTEVSKPDHLQLPALFFCFSSQNFEEAKRYHAILKDKKEFRDVRTYGMMQKALLDALQPLIVQHHFKNEEIVSLLKKALEGNIKANLFSIQGTLNCGGEDRLRKEAQTENPDLEAAYQFAFAQAIPIKPIKDFSTKYEQTFGRSALPTAPLTYAGKLRQLPKNEQEKALPALSSFIYSVLEGEYPEIRYKRTQTSEKESESKESAHLDHLQKIFDNKPSLKKEWPIEIDQVPLENYLPATSSKISFDPQRFLLEKREHLPKEKYPLLHQFLETKDPKIAKDLGEALEKLTESTKERTGQAVILRNALSILKDIEKKNAKDKTAKLLDCLLKAKEQLKELPGIAASLSGIEELAKLVKAKKQTKEESPSFDEQHVKSVQALVNQFKKAAEETRSEFAIDDEENQRLLLQKDLIDLYRSEKATLSQQLGQLNKILLKLSKSREEFLNDVKGIVEALGKQKQSFDEYTLVNTDRFDFMLLCGTQVQGSCQRIDGVPGLNKCLLAYLMDGKNRLIAIKDKEGNIVARSILRLLWDSKGDVSVLMQERVYSNIADDNLTVALDMFAKAQSERLGVPLYRPDEAGTASLESFGSIAPWEYVDSADGVHADGIFTITKASVVA